MYCVHQQPLLLSLTLLPQLCTHHLLPPSPLLLSHLIQLHCCTLYQHGKTWLPFLLGFLCEALQQFHHLNRIHQRSQRVCHLHRKSKTELTHFTIWKHLFNPKNSFQGISTIGLKTKAYHFCIFSIDQKSLQ